MYQPHHVKRTSLTEKAVRYAIRQRQKCKSPSKIAAELGITPRYVRILWARFRDAGRIPVPRRAGRPKRTITQDAVRTVLEWHGRMPAGVVRLTRRLKAANQDISYGAVYHIMKSENMITPSPAKSRRRRWVRYERRYSNAMWHVDWHRIKDPRLKGLNLIAFLDDASRCISGFGVFEDATSENAALVLRKAMREYGVPPQMLSDNGRCFAAGKTGGGPKKRWNPTTFEQDLLENGISLITARPYHPQTNGKLERFFRTFEEEFVHFDRVGGFMEFYNEQRTHFSLDMKRAETPLMAFHNKKVPDEIRKGNPKWMEEDTND